MTPSDSTPKLPIWIFLVTDAALIAAAWFVASESRKPLSLEATLAIVGCIGVGALVALVPLISRFERAKNEALDDRQRALEALARTVTGAAEQISIATAGLHEIVEVAQRNLRHAEQLPHKLQDKIAEFQSLLANADAEEREELEKELVTLRASESERLEAVATKISRTTAEFTKLEAATQHHLAAANESLAKLSLGTAAAIGKAQAAAEQALAAARTEAAKGLGEAAGHAAKSIETAKAAALADLEAKLDALVERVARELAQAVAAAAAMPVAAPAPAASAPDADADAAQNENPAQPPRRPRKRRDDSAPEEVTAPAGGDTSPVIQVVEEPPPIPIEKIPEVTPVVPHTAEPFEDRIADPTVPPAPAMPEAPKSPRKRPAKKGTDESAAGAAKEELSLGIDDAPGSGAADLAGGEPPEAVERVLSSDGATRLIVTAYIGIGNRVFIRGSGPGLSWEKGVPLQFVSIGKWRWETNDATGPVQFKLFKNDDVECTTLGAQQLDPGYQQEVTAAF